MREKLPGAFAPRADVAGLEQRVRLRLRRLLIEPNPRVVLGLSGGPDSLALAAILAGLERTGDLTCLAVHVDHALRPDSAEEQNHAAELAGGLGLGFRARRLKEGVVARHPGVGLEEAARRERYLELSEVAAAEGADLVAIAHQQEDQAETVLLHLLRGAGLAGATGMAELANLTVPWWEVAGRTARTLKIWRPLLDESRDTLGDYLAARGLTSIYDPSNEDQSLRRNALRHRALPLLDEIFPDASAALARFGRLAADDDAALDVQAARALAEIAAPGSSIAVADLADLPLAIQRRVIRRWLGDGGSETSLERIEAIRDLLHSDGGRRVQLPGQRLITLKAGRLHLTESSLPDGDDS